MENEKYCFLCHKVCDNLCNLCKNVYFCSKEHYILHRYEESCLPFKASYKTGIGRILIATRNIKSMELILVDPGTIKGPNYCSNPVCLECLLPIKNTQYCPSCQFPMCSEECIKKKNVHSNDECEILSRKLNRSKVLSFQGNEPSNAYTLITPLRGLFLQESNSDGWKRTNQLMDHIEDRQSNTEDWNWFQKNIVEFFRNDLGCHDRWTEEQIHHVIGLLNVNAVALQFSKSSKLPLNLIREGKGLYPIFAIMSHYCICNARYTINPYNLNMYVRARNPIQKGEEISVQYLSALYGNFIRRRKIRDDWYFDCLCSRCTDPTERGSYVSAINCFSQKCNVGFMLPRNTLIYDSEWACLTCGHTEKSNKIHDLMEELEKELNDIGNCGKFSDYQDYITKYDSILLHPNHYLLMMAKRNLIQYWTYGVETLSIDKLQMKIKMCLDFYRVLCKIDPGYSELRSFIQKELNFSRLVLCQHEFDNGLINREEYLVKSRQSLSALDELEKQRKVLLFTT